MIKYPRTYHLPSSPGATSDDKVLKNVSMFIGKRVVVTEKMDGENTSMYRNYLHARSIDGRHHPSRDWVKALHGTIQNDIPDGWRVCGENLYARHSIEYDDLPSYFMGFSMWDDQNVCLSWEETTKWFDLLGIISVPVLYDGIFDEKIVASLYDPNRVPTMEGYVVRLADSFAFDDFKTSVAKFVRPNHVQTDEHWMTAEIVPNKLRI